jgi:hypothetical protein
MQVNVSAAEIQYAIATPESGWSAVSSIENASGVAELVDISLNATGDGLLLIQPYTGDNLFFSTYEELH